MSKSPPGGIAAGAVAVGVMVLALAGVIPQVMFLVGAVGLIVVAYMLDKRFKANMPATPAAPPATAPSTPTAWPVASPVAATPPSPTVAPTDAWPPAPSPATPSPALLPVGDLQAEHARLTQELTDRVDDDEDVRFEKFMRLRKIEEELERQQAAPPS